MKRLFSFIVLLSLLGVVAGCNKSSDSAATTDTNAPSTTTSTNK